MWVEILMLVLALAVFILVWGLFAVGLFDLADYMDRRRDAKRTREKFVPYHDLLE